MTRALPRIDAATLPLDRTARASIQRISTANEGTALAVSGAATPALSANGSTPVATSGIAPSVPPTGELMPELPRAVSSIKRRWPTR